MNIQEEMRRVDKLYKKRKIMAVLYALSYPAEDTDCSPSEYDDYYNKLETAISDRISRSFLSGDFSFNDLLELAIQRGKSYQTVLADVQKTAQVFLNRYQKKKYSPSGSRLSFLKLMEEINKKAEYLKTALLSGGYSGQQVDQLGNLLAETEKNQTRLLDQLNQADKLYREAAKALEEAKETNKNMLSTVLTNMGIFTAIIMAAVAAFFNGVADRSAAVTTSVSQQVLLSSLRWHVTYLLVFFLLFLVGKLSGRSLASKCPGCEGECAECGEKCGYARQIWRRYPWLVVLNGLFLLVELVALLVIIWQTRGWGWGVAAILIPAVVGVIAYDTGIFRKYSKKYKGKK